MDINPEDYRRLLDTLEPGEIQKVPHIGCSSSACLRVQADVDGIKFYCFKCREYHFESILNSPRERLHRQKVLDATTRLISGKDYTLPLDFSQTIPSKGLAWLGRGGWTLEMISRYNIGYSKELNRVVLPVYTNCIHQGYTMRALEKWQNPKYIEVLPPGTIWESSGEPGDTVVLCEDILSAGRVGEFTKTYALLGTTIDSKTLITLSNYKRILFWFDSDQGGRAGLLSGVNRVRMLSSVQIIRSDDDPKNLTDGEIQFKLKDYI